MKVKELLFLLVANEEWEGTNQRSIHLVFRDEDDELRVWSGATEQEGPNLSLRRRSKVLSESHSRSGITNISTEDTLLFISIQPDTGARAQIAQMSFNGITLIDATPLNPEDYEFVSKGTLSNKLIKK